MCPLPPALALTNFSSRATEGLIFQYNFDDRQIASSSNGGGEVSMPSAARDSQSSTNVLGDLILQDARWLESSIGIEMVDGGAFGVGATSEKGGAALQNLVEAPNGEGMTFEMWYMPSRIPHPTSTMLSISRDAPECPPSTEPGGLLVEETNSGVGAGLPKRKASAIRLKPVVCLFRHFGNADIGASFGQALVHHMAFTMQNNYPNVQGQELNNIWHDGIALDPNGIQLPVERQGMNWTSEPLRLAPGGSSAFWGGSVFMIAMYNRTLSSAEIQGNYRAFLANSAPVVTDFEVTVQAGSEVAIALTYGEAFSDFDRDQQTAWGQIYSGTEYPGYGEVQDAFSVVVHPPSQGMLIHQGQNITQAQRIVGDATLLLFVPPAQVPGASVDIPVEFEVSDGAALSETGTCTVRVTRKNSPPVPVHDTVRLVDGSPLLVTLRGNDPDFLYAAVEGINASLWLINQAWVESVPTFGALYQVEPGLGQGSLIQQHDEVDYLSPDGHQVWFVPGSTAWVPVDVLASTLFTFSLGNRGEPGGRSDIGQIDIQVLNVLGVSNDTVETQEDTAYNFALPGINRERPGDVQWQLQTLPAAGVLLPRGALMALRPGTPFDGRLTFVPPSNFAGGLSFWFGLRDSGFFAPEGRVRSAEMRITVREVNDRTNTIVSVGGTRVLLGNNINVSITISDPDGDNDTVKVALRCPESLVYLPLSVAGRTPRFVDGKTSGGKHVEIQNVRTEANLFLGHITVTAGGQAGTEQCSVTVNDRMTNDEPVGSTQGSAGLEETVYWSLQKDASTATQNALSTRRKSLLLLLLLLLQRLT